jgi:hypothetical protein
MIYLSWPARGVSGAWAGLQGGRGCLARDVLVVSSKSSTFPSSEGQPFIHLSVPQEASISRIPLSAAACTSRMYLGEMARHAVIITPASGNIRWAHPFHDHQPGKREVMVTQLPTVPRWRHLVVPYRPAVMQASAD